MAEFKTKSKKQIKKDVNSFTTTLDTQHSNKVKSFND